MILLGNQFDKIYEHILRADRDLEGIIHRTPLDKTRTFSEITKSNIYLKLENLQKTGSFKARGAYYKISNLPGERKRKGVIAASAGNHAQGVAYAAKMANTHAKIVMPVFAPIAKILATRSYGADVILHGYVFDDALKKALEIAEVEERTFIHAFDDEYIIAGQGTIGLEILKELPDPDIIIVPVGGGGLISGISIAVKKKHPNVKIIGVQSKAFPAAYELKHNVSIESKAYSTIADGIAVKTPGEITSEIISEIVDDIILVDDNDISRAIFLLLERGKILAEGAGAISVGALISGQLNVKHKNVVAVISGGNIDFTLLSKIISREAVRMKRLVKIRTIIPDRPGSLSKIISLLSEARINIVDIITERYDFRAPPYEASLEIIVEVPEKEMLMKLLSNIREQAYQVEIEEV